MYIYKCILYLQIYIIFITNIYKYILYLLHKYISYYISIYIYDIYIKKKIKFLEVFIIYLGWVRYGNSRVKIYRAISYTFTVYTEKSGMSISQVQYTDLRVLVWFLIKTSVFEWKMLRSSILSIPNGDRTSKTTFIRYVTSRIMKVPSSFITSYPRSGVEPHIVWCRES